MISCKAIGMCQSSFQGKPLVLSLPQSVNSSLKKKNVKYGMIAMAQGDNSMRDTHFTSSMSMGADKQETKKMFQSQALQCHQFPTTNFASELFSNKTTNQFQEYKDGSYNYFERLQGIGDDSWEEWEEWMGWEGAGTLDYSNHINSSNKITYQFQEYEDDSSYNFERLWSNGDDSWEEWEEWMGWEGAGTLDYSNHINSSA